ncbi:MAG: protein-glutamate O-methyltransferase CheR [Myxococcales bacterium]|nr:protein-glutamate O-methyltransferase CheR [Myxococcales bacterium]
MSLLFDQGPSMSHEEFRLIRDLVNELCGIAFGDDAKFVVERRLRERLTALGLSDYGEYYRLLRFDLGGQAELERAIELLTTNETYFFREAYQLQAFEEEILPSLAARNAARKRLTIWSAGCSSGEEVYTIAMLVAQTERFDGWEVRVFGSDISRRVLAQARRAVYREPSFRAMPSRFDRHFVETSEGRAVRPEIRAMCHFGQLNLLDHGRSAIVGAVDVIFCRNVLIYFDPTSRARVVRTFFDRLVPGGYLLLGHSESLLRSSTDFELVHLRSDMVYRRPLVEEHAR